MMMPKEEGIYFNKQMSMLFGIGAVVFCCFGCCGMAIMLYICRKSTPVMAAMNPDEIKEINR
jgi:hypothetical protein